MKWTVLALLFAATILNYLDRSILAILLPEIRKDLAIPTETYGLITFWFQIAYAAGAVMGGAFLDRFGTRIGYGLAAALGSAAASFPSLASNALQFGVFRLLLGLAEAPHSRACKKTTTEWFVAAQRPTAMGVANFGAIFATIIGAPLLIFLSASVGWRTCFALLGALGFLWLPFWLWANRGTSRAPSRKGGDSLVDLLRHKQTWGYVIAKFLTEPVWWFYFFWLNPYLADVRHFTPVARAASLAVIYTISATGPVLSSAASSYFVNKGWPPAKARKMTMLICALAMPACSLGVIVNNNYFAIALFGLATAAHQTLVTASVAGDAFPKHADASAASFGRAAGALGGALFSGIASGYAIPVVGYAPVLLTMSCFYLIAHAVIHWLTGNHELVQLEEDRTYVGQVSKPAAGL